jgi:hypothetical protein
VFVILTEDLGWAAYFKLSVILLLADEVAGGTFAPDMADEVL